MPKYSFTSLSAQDFEELVRDLLQAEWGVPLEAFKAGRDSGIDLRYAPAGDGTTIIQCKHYAASGFRQLISHLSKIELPKVKKLRPNRYIVVTSVGLTPANKDAIASAMKPYILSTGDILGVDEVEGLLTKHQSVERANFKLWLTSTAVLERVLHNAEHCQTNFALEKIQRKLPLFVQNEAFPRAKTLLDDTRIVVISGVPGIGKTTLAEMLLYAHQEHGYEPVVIQGEISEGKKLFKPSSKQIFYFDDFLGQTFLGDRREYLGRNEDASIIDFAEMIQQSEHGKFILTTREHILRSAQQVSEKFAHSALFHDRCVIELADYSYGQKARILYNHLYFSDLPQAYRNAILEDHFFLKIIKHEHFNPRLIEWLSTFTRLKQITSSGYQSHISSLLQSPFQIWNHAFENQISDAARDLLLTLYTVGEWVDSIDLEPAFASHRHLSAQKYNKQITPAEFRKTLQELDDAFLSYHRSNITFLNPSIREFIGSLITNNRDLAEDLLESAVRFRQITSLWELATAHPENSLSSFLNENEEKLFNAIKTRVNTPVLKWEKMRDGTRRGYFVDVGIETRIAFIIEVGAHFKSSQFAALGVLEIANLVGSWDLNFPDFSAAIGLLETVADNNWFLTKGGRNAYRNIVDGLLRDLNRANADDWLSFMEFPEAAIGWTDKDEARLIECKNSYCSYGAEEEIGDCANVDEMTELSSSLERLSLSHDFKLDRALQKLQEEIFEREDPYEDDREYSYSGGRESISQDTMSDDEITQMFGTLKDSTPS